MPQLKAFYRPASLQEALGLLQEHGERARPLAGGTSLVFNRGPAVEALVDLAQTGLDGLEADGATLRLGAMLRASALRKHLTDTPATALSEATQKLYSRVVQNHVTIGGNCVMVYGWSDLPLATWCLDASFTLQAAGGTREVAADAFYAKHPTKLLGQGELLTRVTIPAPAARQGSAYRKHGRDKTDEALAAVAACVVLDDAGVVVKTRLVIGGVRPLPQKLEASDLGLAGKKPDAALLTTAGALAAKAVTVTDNYLASADYRRDLVATLVEDALLAAVERAQGAA